MAAGREAAALLEALREQVSAVAQHSLRLLQRLRAGQLQMEKGLPPLHVRAQLLLLYLQDLGLLLGAKVRGRSLKGSSAPLQRLLESRVVLEKLRPLEQRLQYQVQKLLRAALIGQRGREDPLSFRPVPANMETEAEREGEEEEEEEEEEAGRGPKAPGLGGGRRYVPPRLVPVQYDEAGPSRLRRDWARWRRQALSSSVIGELREELGHAPTEEGPAQDGAWRLAARRRDSLRTRLEESLLVRLRAGPGRGQGAGPGPGGGALDSITDMGNIRELLQATNQEVPPPKKKKRKLKVTKKKGKGFRRRR